MPDPVSSGRFDIAKIAAAMPAVSETMLVDHYMTDRPEASARVFRVYRGAPPHYHVNCDEYLYVFSGRGTFWIGDASNVADFGPGQLLFFEKGTVHCMPELTEEPVVFVAIDTPRRDPKDVIFVDPADGTAETFIRQNY